MEFEYDNKSFIKEKRKKIIRVLSIMVIVAVLMVIGSLVYFTGFLKLSGLAVSGNDAVAENVDLASEENVIQASLTPANEINQTDPPSGISLGNIEENNLSIYQVDYNGKQDNLFVVKFSS